MADLMSNEEGPSEEKTAPPEQVSVLDPKPIFNPLRAAKSDLVAQTQYPSHLHPFHSSSQALYAGQSEGTHLSRDQFRQLLAQIRYSVDQFGSTSPALQPHFRANAQPTTFQNQGEAVTSDAVRRYISLFTEASTHTVALSHSVESLRSTAANGMYKTRSSFPISLLTGCLSSKQSKQPMQNWEDAVEALGALSDTVEQVARSLGLEAFSEAAQDTSAPQEPEASALTHTLTLGAKIMVIDVEYRAVQQASLPRGFRPKCRFNLSYANDSESTQRDPQLGLCLERDIQSIADRLFGISTDVQGAQMEREAVIDSLDHFCQSLAELAALDDLCAQSNQASQPVDLFDAMQKLSSAMASVSQAEAASGSAENLLDRGHGISSLHKSRPFLHTTYARDPISGTDYSFALEIKPLSMSLADKTECPAEATLSLSPQAAKVVDLANADLFETLGSISTGSGTVPLHFVIRLDPPVIVTRSTAAKLASVCQLRQQGSPSAMNTAATQATWFEDILSESWSQRPVQPAPQGLGRFTFTLARTVDSLRDPGSQGLVVDSVPLLVCSESTGSSSDQAAGAANSGRTPILSRLLTVVEILRDEVKLMELTRSAIVLSGEATNSTDSAKETTLDELLAGTAASTSQRVPVTLSFRFPSSASDLERKEALMLEMAFQVATKEANPRNASLVAVVSVAETGWVIGADVRLPGAGGQSHAANLEAGSPVSQAIAVQLSRNNSLEDAVSGLIGWAEDQLQVQFDVRPPADDATVKAFDPLAYEQANVHAVYETIAPHFSSTRYKPWPLIPAFLETMAPGSLGADLGCGNGKYLPLRSTVSLSENVGDSQQNSLLTIGVDRSSNLVKLARDNFGMVDSQTKSQLPNIENGVRRRQEVSISDAIQSSLRTGVFDYAISIATIHHFSTWERRRAAVHELIRLVAPVHPPTSEPISVAPADPRLGNGHGRGRFMIFVWALEQKLEGKRQFEAQDPVSLKENPTIRDPNNDKAQDRLVSYSGLTVAERREQQRKELQEQEASTQAEVTDDQDVLVPWVLTTASKPKQEKTKKARGKTSHKNRGATTEQGLASAVSGLSLKSGSAADAPVVTTSAATSSTPPVEEAPVYNRYYHVFRAGELESLVANATATMTATHVRPGSTDPEAVDVVCEASGWERGNWWGVWRVQWQQQA